MKYVNYDEKTGKILGYYDKEIHGKWIPPQYDENGNMIKEGYWDLSAIPQPFVEITDEQWQEAINNHYNYIDPETKTMGIKDFRTLDQLKQAKKQEIETTYQNALSQPINYTVNNETHTFQADQHSQDILTKVIVGAPSDFTTNWLDIDNVPVQMTLADLKGLAQAILQRGEQLFQKKVLLKQQVAQATTKEDLDAIQINF